ncbi:hypothetical protein CRE_20034 [Caenorhabditis remanei]|uniref:Uncharacterized protein n=1 Tax=Caenorhabditis remanei TaxID=31234 RepID=E3NFF0_CAERE|nr:hypothetical protein CRE_20034 [Caenorhabditis remanei]
MTKNENGKTLKQVHTILDERGVPNPFPSLRSIRRELHLTVLITFSRLYIADTIEQLNNLTELKLNIGDVTSSHPVEQYLGGELKFQYQIIGHKGAAAKKSCMLIGSYERGKCLKARTETDYLTDSANDKINNIVIPGSAFAFNNVRLPNIVSPSLHILMGKGAHRYGFKYLLDLAMDIDNKSNMEIDISKRKA